MAPTGGLVLAGSTSTWGAGLSDMWTLRLDANAGITFNAASAAKRTATGFARAALGLNAVTGTMLNSTMATVTRTASSAVITTPGFTQNQQAP